jgi:energy-coupling factor transport system ATP-binding protein
MVIATHNMDDIAAMADRVYALEAGGVALQGPTRHVFAQAEKLRSLGLAVPAAAAVMAALHKHGLTVPLDVLTLDEAEAAIVAILNTHPALPSLQSRLEQTSGKAKGMRI